MVLIGVRASHSEIPIAVLPSSRVQASTAFRSDYTRAARFLFFQSCNPSMKYASLHTHSIAHVSQIDVVTAEVQKVLEDRIWKLIFTGVLRQTLFQEAARFRP